jgi:hypothetical protein
MVKQGRFEPVLPPVCESILALFSRLERDALPTHLATSIHRVAKLIDQDRVGVEVQSLLLPLKGIVASDASPSKLSPESVGDFVALAFAGLVLDVN